MRSRQLAFTGLLVPLALSLLAGPGFAGSEYGVRLKADWAQTDGKRFTIQSITRHDSHDYSHVVVVEFVRRGLERQKVQWEARVDEAYDPKSTDVLTDDAIWAGLKEKALAAAPRVDTFDGVRHAKFRISPDGTYEGILKAEPFEAFLMPRIWTGSVLQRHRPIWTILRDPEVKQYTTKPGRVLAVRGRDTTLFGFEADAERHTAYLWSRKDHAEALAKALEEGKTLPQIVGEGQPFLIYSRVLARDAETGLPTRVMTRNETAGLTEWFRLVEISTAQDFRVQEVPELLRTKTVVIADAVTRRVVVIKGTSRKDVTPLAPPAEATDETKGDNSIDPGGGATTFQVVTAGLGILLILGALCVRRLRSGKQTSS